MQKIQIEPFQNYYNERQIVAFYSQNQDKDHREFLFDITVGISKSFETDKKHKVEYVAKSIWQIESEFAKNARETVKDFSKLFSGNAPYQMMVCPLSSDKDKPEYLLDQMKKLMEYYSNTIYFFLLPHPSEWLKKDLKKLWIECRLNKWSESGWEPLELYKS